MIKSRITIALTALLSTAVYASIAATAHAAPPKKGAQGHKAAAQAATDSKASAASRTAEADRLFLEAREAFRVGDSARLARAAQAMSGQVLEPWVGYWQLRQRIEDRGAEELRAYLTRHTGTFLADQLRRDWLRVLGRRGEWALFDEELPRVIGDDPEVACYAVMSRLQAGDPSAAAEVRSQWVTPRELSEGCAALADRLIASGQITPPQLWERFRILVEANQLAAAKRWVARLPRDEAPDLRALERALGSPAAQMERGGAELTRRTGRELHMAALVRIARDDPVQAAGYWRNTPRERFTPAEQAWVLGVIGTAAAKRHQPDAVSWFAEADRLSIGLDGLLSDEQWAWRARIALRQENWKEVQAAIQRMSAAGREDPVWMYWLGRALKAQAQTVEQRAAAQEQFARIAGDFHFYGRLAAEELGLPMRVPAAAASPTADELTTVTANPGLQRALALFRLDLRTEAVREWNWALRGMDDRALLASAQLARNQEIWDRAINTADRTVLHHDFSVRYLAPFREVLGGAARARSLEESFVFGLVRQESRFIPVAKSSAGASGLMQLMPATAQWVARKMGMKDYAWSRVHEPQINASLGTFYLRQVLDELDDHPVLAAAAYNAGPGRARRWRDTRPLEGAIYAESIPLAETRDYVKKVLANAMYYSAVLGTEFRPLKTRLGTIAARSSTDQIARVDPTP